MHRVILRSRTSIVYGFNAPHFGADMRVHQDWVVSRVDDDNACSSSILCGANLARERHSPPVDEHNPPVCNSCIREAGGIVGKWRIRHDAQRAVHMCRSGPEQGRRGAQSYLVALVPGFSVHGKQRLVSQCIVAFFRHRRSER